MSTAKPYKLDVSDDLLSWIDNRVKTARVIPDVIHASGDEWIDGTPTAVMNEIVDYWKTKYDWRAIEKKINETFNMFVINIQEADEDITLHFVHHRSDRKDAIPLLLSHGWPGNFLEVEHLLKLTNPEDPRAQAYHIVAPSIPGFTLSSAPTKPGFGIAQIASTYHKLMQALGYSHYVAQGGDWGSLISRSIALQYPEFCIGVHINFIFTRIPSPLRHPLVTTYLALRWLTPEEKKRLGRLQWFAKSELGYAQIQQTKPQTVSYGLLDSPTGMLAWILEKLKTGSEPDFVWENEVVITWTILYLIAGSAWHARIYKEAAASLEKDVYSRRISSQVPFGFSSFPMDVGYVPQWWAAATVAENIVLWRDQPKGGHFASCEVPAALIEDIDEFVRILREKGSSVRWEAVLKAGVNGKY
ncbi:epoxide hydrolase domain-containing protein [Dendrothele bispora CBS 962.96]|uniref:Epoxide hydrolase domain-containing protein n=1 Tax=Dendrothele bispora (strain CBS 962.96) TaxID=1314807 RepID=A0A4V4HI90_DENBC|nr:epoxide hydrolase domain-containing protein [Dendrothele bispora CBS 962.96]